MHDFVWSSGHIGWGLFALLVFSGLWLLLSDVVWRLRDTRVVQFVTIMGAGWILGIVLIVAGIWLG